MEHGGGCARRRLRAQSRLPLDFDDSSAGIRDDKVFAWAKASFAAKHPESDVNRAYLFDFDEGVVAQVMHKGPYDDEPATVAILDNYARSQGYELDLSDARRHHEIYISDPRRAKPENLKTVIRHPVVKVG